MARTHVSCRFFTTELPGKPPHLLLELLRVTLLQDSLPLDYLAEAPKREITKITQKTGDDVRETRCLQKGSVAQVILVLEALLSVKR